MIEKKNNQEGTVSAGGPDRSVPSAPRARTTLRTTGIQSYQRPGGEHRTHGGSRQQAVRPVRTQGGRPVSERPRREMGRSAHRRRPGDQRSPLN